MFLNAPELYICEHEEGYCNKEKGQLIVPQVPRAAVRYTLTAHVVIAVVTVMEVVGKRLIGTYDGYTCTIRSNETCSLMHECWDTLAYLYKGSSITLNWCERRHELTTSPLR